MTLVFQTISVEFLTCIEMSKAFLQQLLEEEIALLNKDDLHTRIVANKEAHKFTVSTNNLIEEIYNQLRAKQVASPQVINSVEMKELITEEANRIVDASYRFMKKFSKERAGNVRNLRKRPGGGYSVTVLVSSGKTRTIDGQRQKLPNDIFDTIKESYRSPRRTAVNRLNKFLSSKGESTQISEFDFLDLDHKGGSVISRMEVNKSKARVGDKTSQFKGEDGDSLSKEDLESLGITLYVSKTDTLAQTTVEVGLRASALNRGIDATKQKKFKKNYLRTLKKALKKLNKSKNFADRQGSDSRTQIERKKIIKAFDKSVRAGKKVKKKTVNTKIKLSKGKEVSKTIKPKVKKGRQEAVGVGNLKIKKNRQKRSSANSYISLAAIINQKLPETVAKNMKLPGLQYRTGRFAGSVRVTDVNVTSQGFPSIGYTYQRNPYQTFEPGGKQGSTERDPRKVIDKSIREIAAGLLVGRFYTRRV